MDLEYKQQLRNAGRHYGYPECCIDAYIKDMEYIERTGETPIRARTDKYPWVGTGFIPCNVHAEQIMQSWDKVMNEILTKRDCKYPFPMDETDMHELLHEEAEQAALEVAENLEQS